MVRRLAVLLLVVSVASSARAALILLKPTWSNGEIPYEIAGNLRNRDFIEAAPFRWNERLGVRVFRPRTAVDRRFLLIVPRSELREDEPAPCLYVERDPKIPDVSIIYLDEKKCKFKDIIHEFGHALGLQHEHQRCDAPTYVRIRADVAATLHSWQWGQYAPMTCGMEPIEAVRRVGEYDLLSVMHYEVHQVAEDQCLLSPCVPFDPTEEGKKLLLKLHVSDMPALQKLREERTCEMTPDCITDTDLAAVKALYRIP